MRSAPSWSHRRRRSPGSASGRGRCRAPCSRPVLRQPRADTWWTRSTTCCTDPFYTQGGPVPSQPDRGPARPDDVFVRALSEANNGSGGWERGWRVAHVDGETVHVERDGLAVRAPLADCHTADGRCAVGAAVSLRRPKELDAGAPGFYLALGDSHPPSAAISPNSASTSTSRQRGRSRSSLCPRRSSIGHESRSTSRSSTIPAPLHAAMPRCCTWNSVASTTHADRSPQLRRRAAHLRTETPAFTQPITPGIAVGEHLPPSGRASDQSLSLRRRGHRRSP